MGETPPLPKSILSRERVKVQTNVIQLFKKPNLADK